MAIEFLDDVNVEANLEVNSEVIYGSPTIKMGNGTTSSFTTMTASSNPGANGAYFEIKYDNGVTGSGDFKITQTTIDCSFAGSSSPITSVSSTGLEITGGLELSGTFKDSSGDVGTAGQVLSSTVTGTNWIAAGGADTNIANTNLTANASRTLTLSNNYSLSFLDSSADVIAIIQATGNQFFGGSFSIRTNSTTTAPTLRLASGTSNNYTGIRSPDTLAASTIYTLPTADGTSGQALTTDGAATMSWATTATSPTLITSGGGRVYMTTASSGGNRAIVLGGTIGFNYYNWSTQMRASNLVFSGLGNPGTTTENVTPSSGSQGAFKVLKSGTIKVQGTVEGQNSTDVYSDTVYIYVFRLPASIVLAMGNGGIQSTAAYELVASAGCVMPATQSSSRPQRFASSNGVSVSEGDFVFAAVAFSGTTTATRYFYTNFQMLTS